MTEFHQEELGLHDPQEEEPDERPPKKERAERVWSVTQVTRAVRVLLEDTIPPLWVSGEVTGWTRARSGHCYFTLKDDSSQLKCVLWKTDAEKLPADPDDGMTVRVLGGLTLYEARGDFQMVARQVETAEGEGLWRLAFNRLKAKLDEEGLTAPERKRPLPRLPARVGVVTSPSGAAMHDILEGLRARGPWLHVVFRGARVQGEGAAQEVASAVRALGASGLVDVIIVGRGGGSLEDLWAFNEEPVARAIATCPVPVVSAVGHEVDVTISDLVADRRAPTPTAAAELVTQGVQEALHNLARLRPRLVRALAHRHERARISRERAEDRIGHAMRALLVNRRSRLERLAGKIHALSPLRTLERGYAVPLGHDGRVLRSVGDFQAGTDFDLRVADGRVLATTHGTERAAALGGSPHE